MTEGFKDRTAGLILFGSLQILFGLCAACMLFAVAAASEMQSREGGGPLSTGVVISYAVLYGLLACYFFTVGVGSIRRRRWARALSLVVSAMWLSIGVIAIGAFAVLLPRLTVMFPPSQTALFVTMMFGITGMIYIVLPLILVLFYRGPNVKATCEAHDVVSRWTDRVPLPVLALVLVLAFSAISVIASAAYGVVPVFGVVLTGAPAIIVLVAIAGLCAYLAVQLYRLKRSAWWTLVLLDVIGAANAAYTFSVIDLEKLYQQMGLMSPQVSAMHLANIYRDPMLWVFMGICWLAVFAYLIWTRRFFNAPPPRTRAGDAMIG